MTDLRPLLFTFFCCLILCAPGGATEGTDEEGAFPVARVNGQAITLRSLENHLLREEGSKAVLTLVERQLQAADWESLADDTSIIAMGNWHLPRRVLATQLLQSHGGRVRDELINIAVIEQALRKEGIVIGRLLLQAERERMERRFQQRLESMGQTMMPFDQFIQQTQGMSIDEFMEQPGFRMMAGLHALVLRRAEVDADTLQAYHRQNPQHFGNPEQVRLQVIILEFEISEDAEGRAYIRDEHRERLRITAAQLHRQISTGGSSFARQWHLWGRMRDPQAGEAGDVGWVGRDGRRSQTGAMPLPQRLLEEAFRVEKAAMPRLLPLVEYRQGIVIAKVSDRREADAPPFEQIAMQIRHRYLEDNLETYNQRVINQLRRDADIEYEALGRIVHQRSEELRELSRKGLRATTGSDAGDASGNAEPEGGSSFPLPQP